MAVNLLIEAVACQRLICSKCSIRGQFTEWLGACLKRLKVVMLIQSSTAHISL